MSAVDTVENTPGPPIAQARVPKGWVLYTDGSGQDKTGWGVYVAGDARPATEPWTKLYGPVICE